MQDEDFNQDHEAPPLPHDVRAMKIERLAGRLQRLPPDTYKALAKASGGMADPHYAARRRAAEQLARILIRG